jgi:hypothetical protein
MEAVKKNIIDFCKPKENEDIELPYPDLSKFEIYR